MSAKIVVANKLRMLITEITLQWENKFLCAFYNDDVVVISLKQGVSILKFFSFYFKLEKKGKLIK